MVQEWFEITYGHQRRRLLIYILVTWDNIKRPFAIISSNNDRYPLNALITKVTLLIIIQISFCSFFDLLMINWRRDHVNEAWQSKSSKRANTMWKVQYSLMRIINDRRRFPLLRNGQNNQSSSIAWKEKLLHLCLWFMQALPILSVLYYML
jgi:hypothetical protein